MSEVPAYYDKRSLMWKKYFDIALDYDSFIKTGKPEEAQLWHDRAERAPELTEEQKSRVSGINREVNILVYAGTWCGDCAREVPMLMKIAEAAGDSVKVKIVDRETSKELQDELRIVGGLRVPIVVFLTEDFWELGRFGDRLLHVYRSKAAREIGRGMDEGVLSPGSLKAEISEWLDIFERMLLMARLSPPLRKRHND